MLTDIVRKLSDGLYGNEEHVRLSLVARILHELGWDIWNPNEVNSEFSVLPHEDKSRVDIALFLTPYVPSVFVEIKSVGKLEGSINQIEQQLRDYNRNNTALFSIITDGQKWRFYYSQTGGEFAQKCFKTLDILKDDIEDIELSFQSFLSKSEISNGNAKVDAQSYLQLSQKQRAMEDALAKARRIILEPPYPSLPQAIVKIVAEAGFTVSDEEAIQFVKDSTKKVTSEALPYKVLKEPEFTTTTPPLHKEKSFQVLQSNYTSRKPRNVTLLGISRSVRSWKEVIVKVCEILNELHPADHEKFLRLEKYLSHNSSKFHSPVEISSTGIFVETNRSANAIMKMCKRILVQFGYSENDLQLSLRQEN